MKDILGLLVLSWPLTLLVLIGITFLVVIPMAVKYAAKHGRSKWRWGIGAFLLVYLPIFWDWIPTVVVHKYYCDKEAGFWVYKTLDQWNAENPGVIETLTANNTMKGKFVGDQENYTLIEIQNQRFNRLTIRKHDVIPLLPIGREEQQLVDTHNNFVIARQIGFGSHGKKWDGLKFWQNISGCSSRKSDMDNFGSLVNQFNGAEK